VDWACRFLLDRQQEDGGWDEVKAVQALNPPEWMTPGRIETRVWLTAYCAHVLIRFGYAEAPGTYCPTDFLLAHCDESGRLAGYLRATWIALPMLAFYPGPDSEPFRRALAVVEANYSPDWERTWPGSCAAPRMLGCRPITPWSPAALSTWSASSGPTGVGNPRTGRSSPSAPPSRRCGC